MALRVRLGPCRRGRSRRRHSTATSATRLVTAAPDRGRRHHGRRQWGPAAGGRDYSPRAHGRSPTSFSWRSVCFRDGAEGWSAERHTTGPCPSRPSPGPSVLQGHFSPCPASGLCFPWGRAPPPSHPKGLGKTVTKSHVSLLCQLPLLRLCPDIGAEKRQRPKDRSSSPFPVRHAALPLHATFISGISKFPKFDTCYPL